MRPEQSLLEEYAGQDNLDLIIPRLARDDRAMRRIEAVVRRRPTSHDLVLGDSRTAAKLDPGSVHLVVTSPPYWTLKRYNETDDQLEGLPHSAHGQPGEEG